MDPIIANVKAKRVRLNVSLMELAKQLDIPYDRMYKWEMRGTKPKHEDIIKLTNWLNNDPVKQVVSPLNDTNLERSVEALQACVHVLQSRLSQLIADKSGRSSLVELESIQKEIRDVQSVRLGES